MPKIFKVLIFLYQGVDYPFADEQSWVLHVYNQLEEVSIVFILSEWSLSLMCLTTDMTCIVSVTSMTDFLILSAIRQFFFFNKYAQRNIFCFCLVSANHPKKYKKIYQNNEKVFILSSLPCYCQVEGNCRPQVAPNQSQCLEIDYQYSFANINYLIHNFR